MNTERNTRKKISGDVIKKSGTKTISVLVETLKRHELYGKVYKVSKKYLVHDDAEIASVGDKVVASSCRPISKQKRWRLVSKIAASTK